MWFRTVVLGTRFLACASLCQPKVARHWTALQLPSQGSSSRMMMSTTSSLQEEVQRMIESWVTECRETKPSWEEQKQTIGERICQLAQQEEHDQNKEATKSTKRSRNDFEDDPIKPPSTIQAKPQTLLELTQYILSVFTDEKLQELKLMIEGNENFWCKFTSRVEFQQGLDKVSLQGIERLCLGSRVYDTTDLQEAYEKVQTILFPSSKLVEKINTVARSFTPAHNVLAWDETLVEPMNNGDLDFVNFATNPLNGAALVVSGESGSGKTWFAQNYIPHKLGKQNLALIYYCVDRDDGNHKIQSDPQVKDYAKACQFGMNALIDAGLDHGLVYDAIANLSMQYTRDRDAQAYEWLKEVITSSMNGDSQAWKWWNLGLKSYNSEPVEKLVLVIDEVGKNPELASSLVSIVRQLYQDITVTHEKAKQVLLVLVGSGIDWYIRNDHLPYAGDDKTRNTYSTFGTDPHKANIIVLKGPNLLPKQDLDGIPTSALLKGTYSSTLSTNTRMLTRGILQVLKNPMFAGPVFNKSIERCYEELGSTNVVMDYAPKVYISLGGLSNLQSRPALFNKMLLTQFRLLLWERLFSIKETNPAAAKLLEDLQLVGVDFHQALALGIVTADIKSTSAALRYLACDGFSAPNVALDGLEFDVILQHHLLRLCEAYHSVQDTSGKEQDETEYWAGHYMLKSTWPPCSDKEDMNLCDPNITRNEVDEMYKVRIEDQMDRDMVNGYDQDIDAIIELVKGKRNFDLVLRQEVHDLQGANFMILRKRKGKKKYSLDLYYANQYRAVPGIRSDGFKKALQRVGVMLEEKHEPDTINITPDYGSAGYTYQGTSVFADKLGGKFRATVEIGHRTMIFAKGWNGKPGDQEFLQKALEKGVMVWTREMLEPTISAFKSQQNHLE